LKSIDTYQFGLASLELGAGRRTKSDVIDHKAGIILFKKIGNAVKKGELIYELHSDSQTKIKTAKEIISGSITFSETKPSVPSLVKKIIY
jgi:pyrimidine-nucleoside phosphorylase